jgi:type VI secretion system protein ImpH
MAGTDRKTTHNLNPLIEVLEKKPYAVGFNYALRLVESLYKERPRLGTAKGPADEPIRLSQEPELTFESASLTKFTYGANKGPHRLSVRLLGLLGPNGPLPLHFTEYIKHRRRDYGDRTFAHFLDIFHHRMLTLFYRAWANNEPTVSYDRPEADRFGDYVGALAGLGMASLHKRDAIPDQTKFYYCGRLAAHTRCPEGLQAILTDYFNLPAAVEEFIGEWIDLPAQHICRLGIDKTSASLGQSVVLGSRAWSCQHKFRIHLGPLEIDEYERFLPAGDRIGRLVPLVRNYIGDELAWDVRLILKHSDVPSTRLDGSNRLGWTTWLGERADATDANDLVLDAFDWVTQYSGYTQTSHKEDGERVV